MTQHTLPILIQLGAAWLAGSLIGLERSFRGRPAGFRTHALVSLASALLMLITAYPQDWLPSGRSDVVNTILDPQRMAQGIMTGIGFLGAGVIFKEGLTVRGLTTAASIWITSALGILYGVGYYFPAILGTVATLGTLQVFHWIESWMPTQAYAHFILRFPRTRVMSEDKVQKMMRDHGFSVANINYRMEDGGKTFEYRMTIQTTQKDAMERLAVTLRDKKDVLEFRISPAGD
ncbi:MAG: MgtC/SapB family protein [Xanthobacteraceae bacterium]|nr:MgtC/SapB family protein [Xanthobacteraceae bacterium]MBX3533594.1 MgtC/SapB family protein [Xanthobacteraceae bacterium]MBX3548311.1 MgtC/SapB family protein [Xanthobacteraceae bacterium]MCW5675709.1 MgtC/SapB family protein [Xanthobacteraceae bacterium]MCW5679244.1 MgtC/SapB family protein [Xanthobacteraceae bacterium]